MHVSNELLKWVVWNTFLALIPVASGWAIYALYRRPGRTTAVRSLMVLLAAVWFAFMPNTCYLLTEWRHFLEVIGYTDLYAKIYISKTAAVRLMLYTLFYIFYSGIGLLTFALAIRPVVWLMKERRLTPWLWAIPFFLLMSLGVYLGLILRLNSWDIFVRPEFVWASIVNTLANPGLMSIVAAFAGFLWLVYLVMDIWIDGLVCRWQGARASS